jgi:hypothetical protein
MRPCLSRVNRADGLPPPRGLIRRGGRSTDNTPATGAIRSQMTVGFCQPKTKKGTVSMCPLIADCKTGYGQIMSHSGGGSQA